jgi:hypothetical protein
MAMLLGLVAVAAVGCGGGTPRSTVAGFNATANGVCDNANDEIAALPALSGAGTSTRDVRTLVRALSIVSSEIEQLRVLAPPRVERAPVRAWLALLGSEQARSLRVVDELRAGRPAVAAATGGATSADRARRRAAALGLGQCAERAMPGQRDVAAR